MPLVIDGYNVLFVLGLLSADAPAAAPRRAREALLRWLAAALPEAQRAETTVVFDAKAAPPGRPEAAVELGIAVRYAVGYADADELIEQLIRSETAPRRLTVVSSDHRVQRAARRRGATAVDSDVWYDRTERQRARRGSAAASADEGDAEDAAADVRRRAAPLTAEEVARWLTEFGDLEEREASAPPENAAGLAPSSMREAEKTRDPRADLKPGEAGAVGPPSDLENPFPPGYAEDLLREEGPP